ncbi:MAG: photosynthetic complex putative assembly protein PuhB [Gemmatimonadales bacterium]|nr:photosynthetic complex putative assembly protein PuhB [Gemmatimonadales bacterium]
MMAPTGERIDGIPYPLPPGERVRWQGKPAVRSLAWRAFQLRTVTLWLLVPLTWQLADAAASAQPVARATGAVVLLGLLWLVAAATSTVLAWSARRTAVYAITDRRVVIRVGMVLSSTVNIPFRMIQNVTFRAYRDGTGDIALELPKGERIAWFQLYPHVRPWHFTWPQPALRSVPHAAEVAQLLGEALRGSLAEGEAAAEAPPAPGTAARPSSGPSAWSRSQATAPVAT